MTFEDFHPSRIEEMYYDVHKKPLNISSMLNEPGYSKKGKNFYFYV